MSSAEAGPARATLSRRSLVRSWLSCCSPLLRRCTACGSSGFHPLYGTTAVGRGHAGAPGASRLGPNPRPRRPAHPQRADLPGQWRRRSAAADASAGDHAHRIRDCPRWCKVDGDALGQIYAVHATFKLVDIKSKKVVLQGTSHARAGFERFPVDLLQRARSRGRGEPRGKDHRRGPEDPACGLPLGRGLRRAALHIPAGARSLRLDPALSDVGRFAPRLRIHSMVAIKTHQASAFLNALDRVPPGSAALRIRRRLGGGAGAPARQGARWARRPAGRDPAPRRCRPRGRPRPHLCRAADRAHVRRTQGRARRGGPAGDGRATQAAGGGRQSRRAR